MEENWEKVCLVMTCTNNYHYLLLIVLKQRYSFPGCRRVRTKIGTDGNISVYIDHCAIVKGNKGRVCEKKSAVTKRMGLQLKRPQTVIIVLTSFADFSRDARRRQFQVSSFPTPPRPPPVPKRNVFFFFFIAHYIIIIIRRNCVSLIGRGGGG